MKPYHLRQFYLNIFRTRSKAKAINSIKSLCNIVEIRDVVDCVKRTYATIPNDIEGVLYPKTLDELCKKPSVFFRPNSVLEEINWILSYMRGHWSNIEWFVEKKIQFENCFLLGDYYESHNIIEEIKNRIGVSLWYYEAKCLLYEYEGESQKCLTFISETLLSCKDNNNYILSILYNLYERSQKKLSPYKFDEDLNALYKRNRTDLHEDYYKYILFRLNYYNQYSNTDLSLPIMFESLSALVDRYLILVTVIKSLLVKDPYDKEIIAKGCYLYNKTKDKNLHSVVALTGRALNGYYNQHYIDMLDCYYSGEYAKCRDYAKNIMVENPACCFDSFVFYTRSLIYLKQGYETPYKQKPDAPINTVSKCIYNVLTYKNAETNLYALYQFNKNTYSFLISAGLDSFYKIESNEHVDHRLKMMSIMYYDPIFSRMWDDVDEAITYIKNYKLYDVNSVACDVWQKRIKNELVDNLSLPLHIAEPINAEHYYKKGLFSEAFTHAESLYNSSKEYVPIRQTAVAKMVDCLFREGNVQKAINLYVDYYVKDVASVAKVDTSSIIQMLQDNLYEGIRRNIDLLIFVALTCKDSVDKSFILLEFCELNNISKPSELTDVIDVESLGKGKVELLFSLLNNDEILKHYSIIDSFKERLSERKKLLQYNISLNSPQKELYQAQLKKIDDALLVYNLSRNMDESKIYANEDAIINYKLAEIDGLLSRYKLLVDTVISQRKNIYVVNFSGSSFFDNQKGYEEENNTQISINSNGLYEVFNSLYDEIKEQFLNSDYGLVAYLSTRVRHGELESMLRPEMGQRNLILQIKDEEYQNDVYWTANYNLNYSEHQIINNALKLFSKSFDDAVTFLIKRKLQIYDKKEKLDGLFVYDVTADECAFKAMEFGLSLKLHDGDKYYFCQQMFKWLWEKTEQSLENIRNYIDNDFMNTILSSIAIFESTIKDDMPDGYARTEMLSQIRSASEAIRLKIQKVSKWFNVSQPKLEDVDFKAISHQVYNTIRLSSTNCETDDQLSIKGDSFMIKSNYVIHYADIMRNIFYNMFKHSVDAIDGKRHFTLDIEIGSDEVRCKFLNDTSEDPNILNKKFEEKLHNTSSAIGEGGSGIAKINKILRQDLACEENSITMKAVEGKCMTNVVIKLNNFKAK